MRALKALLMLLLALSLQGQAPLAGLKGETVTIESAAGAGALALADGREVRLAGIAVREPQTLLPRAGRSAALYALGAGETRYGQILAHIALENGAWLQERLLREGAALVMPVYERHSERLAALLEAEQAARTARAGIWALPSGEIVCADDADAAFDRFALVQGRVKEAAEVGSVIYLNFGADYRSDFTVKVAKRDLDSLGADAANAVRRLTGGENPDMIAEARGWVFWNGGPMIAAEAFSQLLFRAADSPLVLEECR